MSDVNPNYISDNVQRALTVLKILAGNELMGITPGDIAKAGHISPSNVTRALHNLKHHGLAELHPMINGRWRLSPSYLTSVANHLSREIDRGQSLAFDMKRYEKQR